MDETLWFSIESKVRKLVKDIIEPTIRRVQETKEQNDKLFRKDEVSTERLNNLEIQTSQTAQRLEGFTSYSSKIIEGEANLRSLEQRLLASLDKINQKIDVSNLDILNLNERASVLDNQRVVIEENAAGLEQNMLATKNNTDNQITELKEKFEKRFDIAETNIRNIDTNIKQINKKLENISNDLSETDYLAKKSERITSEHSDKFINVSKLIQQNKKELQDSVEKMRNSFMNQTKEQGESLKRLLRYLENDYKVSINMSIIDHLYSITLDPKMLHKIASHEREKLQEWGTKSLQNTLKDAIEKSKSRCQAIIDTPLPPEPKKKKFSAQSSKESLKKSEAIISQATLKSPPPEVKNEEINDSEPSELNETIQPDFVAMRPISREKVQSPRSIFPEPIYVQNEFEELDLIDYMPYIEELKQIMNEFKSEYIAEISNIYKNMQTLKLDVDDRIKDIKEKQERFIDAYTKKEQEMDLVLNEAIHECNMVSNLRKRDMSDINSSINEVTSKLDNFFDQNGKIEEDIFEISKKISSLMEISKITISLQQQDEVDRESISLMGHKEAKPPSKASIRKQVISIDKTCQSCTGQ